MIGWLLALNLPSKSQQILTYVSIRTKFPRLMHSIFNNIKYESLRPWKLATLGVGLSLLLIGRYYYMAPDWDVAISIIMAGFTYLFAGWSMRVMVERQWRDWPLMIFFTWWCIDGCYALYWSLVNPTALEMMRDANWPASLSLFWICGLVWYWQGSLRELVNTSKLLREIGR